MLNIFEYDFMVRAMIAGLTVAIISPTVGSFLVIRKMSNISDTLSHVALFGVALGLLFGASTILTTLIVSIFAALAIERIRMTSNLSGDAILAMFLPGGLAASLIILSKANSVTRLNSYLFGSITTVQTNELLIILIVGLVTMSLILLNYKRLLFTSFDQESAQVAGVPTLITNSLLMVLVAVVVSASMQVVGALLTGALMIVPVLSSIKFAKSFKSTIMIGILFGLISVFLGLVGSFYLDLPAGPGIVVVSIVIFVFSLFWKK